MRINYFTNEPIKEPDFKQETNKMADLILNDDIFCMYAQIWFFSSLVSIL